MTLVLFYHAVLQAPPRLAPAQRTLLVDPAELDWQLGELVRVGYHPVTLEGFYAALEGARRIQRVSCSPSTTPTRTSSTSSPRCFSATASAP